jgi:hypothetical protein
VSELSITPSEFASPRTKWGCARSEGVPQANALRSVASATATDPDLTREDPRRVVTVFDCIARLLSSHIGSLDMRPTQSRLEQEVVEPEAVSGGPRVLADDLKRQRVLLSTIPRGDLVLDEVPTSSISKRSFASPETIRRQSIGARSEPPWHSEDEDSRLDQATPRVDNSYL